MLKNRKAIDMSKTKIKKGKVQERHTVHMKERSSVELSIENKRTEE